MNDDYVIATPGPDSVGFVELARSQKGRLFKKKILPMNESFIHPSNPNRKIFIDAAFAESLKKNFKDGICDIVQLPIVNDANQHVEDPTRNAGEVVDLSYDQDGVYAILDARKHAEDFGKTLLGASAMMHLDYKDTKTGNQRGPTLLHVAVTNRPFITNLGEFEEIVAASAGGLKTSADTSGETPVVLIPADKTEEEIMDLETLISTLKSEHGIDVQALQSQAAGGNQELLAALSNVLTPEADATTVTISDVADAVIELAEEKVSLSNTVDAQTQQISSLLRDRAEAEIDGLVRAGRILPKQRDKMVELSMSDRETYETLLPENPIVALSAEGIDAFDAPKAEKVAANIERLANLANGN